jgi:hypothetical protein
MSRKMLSPKKISEDGVLSLNEILYESRMTKFRE